MKLSEKFGKTDNLTKENTIFKIKKSSKKSARSSKIGTKRVLYDISRQNTTDLPKNNDEGLVVQRKVFHRKKNTKKPNRLLVFASKFGKTKIEVMGENAHKSLCYLSNVATLTQIEKDEQKITFFVESKHCDKIVAILRKLCYDYKIIEIIGAVPNFARTLIRAGIVVGICASIAGMAVYPSFITKVSVEGDNVAQIESVLNSYGVKEGAFVPKINVKELESVLLKLDGVAFASVRRNGAHVEVCIKKELEKDNLVTIKGQPIVSSKRATVTRVIARGGTAVVKYGDVVDVGDLIIEPYVTMGDDKIEVVADGEAYGKVYYKKSRFFADEYVVTTLGETKTITKISMFGKTPKTPNSPYEVYQLETSVQGFGFLLPIEMHRFEFKQLIATKKANTLTEDEMKSAVYASVLDEFTTPTTVLNAYWEIEKTIGGVKVSVTVEVEEKITV